MADIQDSSANVASIPSDSQDGSVAVSTVDFRGIVPSVGPAMVVPTALPAPTMEVVPDMFLSGSMAWDSGEALNWFNNLFAQ